jgi:ribosome biogenesis GTPase
MLDRFLALCELEGIPPLICLNKIDLSSGLQGPLLASAYERIGYPVRLTSGKLGTGVEALRSEMRGTLAVFLGPSGAGKTTLLNALHPGLGHRVGEVSRVTGRGRHTTSRSELLPSGEGGWIGDTPGLRELGLWQVDPRRVDLLFPEMRDLTGACRFRDCAHGEEPGCAVKAAVEAGEIDPGRYRSYLGIRSRP